MKEQKMTIIAKAVSPLKNIAINRANVVINERIVSALAKLEDGGWDLQKVAPYPKNYTSKSDYREQLAYHEFLKCLTKSTSVSRRLNDPDIRVVDSKAIELIVNLAEADAAAQYDAFVNKLESKIGEVTDANLWGDAVWSYSVLTVTKKDGAIERWKTQCIVNCSVYGKLFNQWPTRKIK